MGYLVETSGRVLLPLDREPAAYDALRARMAGERGWFDPDDPHWPVESLADLAPYAAAVVTRDGDWLVLATDEEGDPKWSDQAHAFYEELGNWVTEGVVTILGEDDGAWRYTYGPDGMTESEVDPSGEPVEPGPAAEAPKRRRWFRRR